MGKGKSPMVKLNDGNEMPLIGLGTYSRASDPVQVKQAVEWGIEAGYRHIDTACSYNNEVPVGQGINSKIQDGTVTREELFVTSKLWNDNHREADVQGALEASLDLLGLAYVDLYLIHWPYSVNEDGTDAKVDFVETWRGMQQVQKLGLARSIGVSNFNQEQLARLEPRPTVNQIEVNPTLTQRPLVEYCQALGVVPVAYTPLGLLSDARPEFRGKDAIKTDEGLTRIADKYGRSKAQICLRYLVQRGIAVIPKSYTKSRIEENIDLFEFSLTDDEMKVIDGYNLDHRCVPATKFKDLTHYPF